MALLSRLSPFVSALVAFSSLLSIQNFFCKQLLNRKVQITELYALASLLLTFDQKGFPEEM